MAARSDFWRHILRARKPKDLDARLERYAAHIVQQPQQWQGSWASICDIAPSEVHLDLGCGKGSFAVESAIKHSNVLFIGVDLEPICIASAAQKACERNIPNAFFFVGDADNIAQLFAPGELSAIHLNFSTPMPPAKCADRRLTYANRLVMYRALLAPHGYVSMKTDSRPLYEWSRKQFELAGYELNWTCDDMHAEGKATAISDFEKRLLQKGAIISALDATPSTLPQGWKLNPEGGMPLAAPPQVLDGEPIPQSLVDFLPDDLENMSYVPHGMEDTVRNIINRRKNEIRRAQARFTARE